MRTPIASALLVVLGLLFFASTGAAQSNPISSEPRQETQKKTASDDAKLLPLPLATQIVPLPSQVASAKDHVTALRAQGAWTSMLQNRIDGLPIIIMRSNGGPDAPNCAHIRIIQAPEMDSEMVLEAPPGAGGDITTFRGLPPCRRDLPAPMTAQRFYGVPPNLPVLPRAPFEQRPASLIPSSQPRPIQLNTDAPAAKP